MRLRQEKVVFCATLALVAALSLALTRGGSAARRRAGAETAEFRHYLPPPVEVALPDTASTPSLNRELFAPPRDTHPLPPLELVEPPRRALPWILPPSDPGPLPRAYGKTLRRSIETVDLPELFAASSFSDEAAPEEAPEEEAPGGADLVSEPADSAAPVLETPAARQARLEGYRRRYDWIQRSPGDFVFGRIENPERYGLMIETARASEALLFVQIDPETGQEFFKHIGAPAIPFERGSIVDFGFAETVANELEIRRGHIGAALTRTSYEEALKLADYAVEQRLEAPRALAIAEELYRLAAAYDSKAPEPKLGLARMLAAAFRFEEAFRELALLVETFPHRAEVHVELALLEERFLLYAKAEGRLRHAVEVDRSAWEAQLGLGGFLARRGRFDEALEHLRVASRVAPSEPELLHARLATRLALADALFALGELAEAGKVYEQALAADGSNQRARAGALATALLLTPSGSRGEPLLNPDAAPGGESEGEGFELLQARGLAALLSGEPARAKELYTLGASADPLRSARSLGALSLVAQITGNAAAALSFAEEALERDPRDPYALYQRGRLLGLADDYEGARSSLLAALERDLEFEDALVALGEVAFRLGSFEDAERYLERAVSLEAGRSEVHALRGLNFLRLLSVGEARSSFERALELDPDEPTARGGLAWCAYLGGDPTEALILFANLDEARRALPEDDPWRAWARAEIARIQDHVQKVEWRDNFNRKRLINSWFTREDAGPIVAMEDGAVKIEGAFTKNGGTQVYREYTASEFVSFAADVWVAPDSNVRAGIFVARERARRDARDVIGEASVSRHKDGALQVRFIRQGQPEIVTDMQESLPTGRWVRLSIERQGSASETAVTIAMDGIPLVEGVTLASLGTANSPLLVGLFAEGEVGRKITVKMDNVAVVKRGAQ